MYKEKILTHYKEAREISSGGMPFPRMALIYPTYNCNHSCPHCLYRGWHSKDYLDKDRLFEIVEELKDLGLEAIEFCGGGEPTLHPDFSEILRVVSSKGIAIGLLTNGSTLNEQYKDFIDNCSYIRISLDSIKLNTYLKMHGSSDLFKVINGIEEAVKYRNEIKSKCRIGIKTILGTDNLLEKPNIEKLGKSLGVDYVQFKAIRSGIGEICGYDKSKLEGKCWLSPLHTMIDPLGDVYICCYYQYRKDKHRIGNIFKDKFKDIWLSEKHKEVIDNINPEECNKYDCRFHYYNKKMTEVLVDDSIHAKFI